MLFRPFAMVAWLESTWTGTLSFVEQGGPVMNAIAFTTAIMWCLLLERWIYLRRVFPDETATAVTTWMARSDRSSWYAHQIRERTISEVLARLEAPVGLIHALIAVCPLLGLLGTVTGMLEVFDVMALAGNANPRALASGISEAILTTVGGLVASLSGMIFATPLTHRIKLERGLLIDRLLVEETVPEPEQGRAA